MEHSEQPLRAEHPYNVREKKEARRKLMKARGVKALIATGAVAAATFLGVSKPPEAEGQKFDSFYNGTVEIVMSENLNVREAPVIPNHNEEPNSVDWNQVTEINGVNVKGTEKIIISKPIIKNGDNPEGLGEDSPWIAINAKVDQLGFPKDETLYVNFSQQTRDYVKPIESGSFIDLHGYSLSEDLGRVEIGTK